MKKVAYIIALVLVLTGSAMAQSSNDGFASAGINIAFGANGVETSKGTFDAVDNKFWGNTFVLNGNNRSETYLFTISMDYLQNNLGLDSGITGGSWSLTVYKNGTYSGTIYGDISGGLINWKPDRNGNLVSRYTVTKLIVTGGTGAFEGISAMNISGNFSATSEVGTARPIIEGTVEIGF